MERLTYHDEFDHGMVKFKKIAEGRAIDTNMILTHLSAYEDTGLTPEEVVDLIERSSPRKIVVETEPDREYVDFICPRCGMIVSQRRKGMKLDGVPNRYVAMYMSPYHDRCGQPIDWGNAKEDYEAALAEADNG